MADDDTYRSESGWHRFVTIPMSAEADFLSIHSSEEVTERWERCVLTRLE